MIKDPGKGYQIYCKDCNLDLGFVAMPTDGSQGARLLDVTDVILDMHKPECRGSE